MALINGFDSDHIFSMDYRSLYPPTPNDNLTTMWNFEEPDFPSIMNSCGVKYGTENFLFPQRLGVSTEVDVAESMMPEFSVSPRSCAIPGIHNFHKEGYQITGQCNHFLSDFDSVYGCSDTWAVQSQSNAMASMEEPHIKVRRYSEEERKDRIMRYLSKRNRRNFNKTIKYACRKTLADRRIRVRGRFARNNDVNQETKETKSDHHCQDEEGYSEEDFELQMKNIGEEWLQEAAASLMFLPIFAGWENEGRS